MNLFYEINNVLLQSKYIANIHSDWLTRTTLSIYPIGDHRVLRFIQSKQVISEEAYMYRMYTTFLTAAS